MINALHADWLSIRHQLSSIPASAAESRMVSPTCIMLASPFLTLLLIDSVCRDSSVEVLQNMRPVDGSSTHYLVGGSHHETARIVFDVHQCFMVSSTRWFAGGFLLLHFSEIFCIFFETGLSWAIVIPGIMTFFSTVVESGVVQVSPGYLLLLFSIAFVVPSFPVLRKHELFADPVGLGTSMRVIIRLMV